MHNKETFTEYLQFVGFTEHEAKTLVLRIIARKASAKDVVLLFEYLDGKRSLQEHLNDC